MVHPECANSFEKHLIHGAMKILITSIRFTNDGLNLLGDQTDGSRALVVELNNCHTITIDVAGASIRYETNGMKITKTELAICSLVYDACRGWLHDWEPETMDGLALSAAGELAEDRIDWSGWPEGEDGERLMELEDSISNYIDF